MPAGAVPPPNRQPWAAAQEARATLLGVITDPTGAVLPAARLTATNTETEVRYSAESNGEGNYVIPYLPPGTRRLRVEQDGFRTLERGPFELRISDRLRIDATLQCGRVTESVLVTIDPTSLQSADASMGSVIDSRRVAELPIAHDNAYNLIHLVAGVAYAGNPTLDALSIRPTSPTTRWEAPTDYATKSLLTAPRIRP